MTHKEKLSKITGELHDIFFDVFIAETTKIWRSPDDLSHKKAKKDFNDVCSLLSQIHKKMNKQAELIDKMNKVKEKGGLVV